MVRLKKKSWICYIYWFMMITGSFFIFLITCTGLVLKLWAMDDWGGLRKATYSLKLYTEFWYECLLHCWVTGASITFVSFSRRPPIYKKLRDPHWNVRLSLCEISVHLYSLSLVLLPSAARWCCCAHFQTPITRFIDLIEWKSIVV